MPHCERCLAAIDRIHPYGLTHTDLDTEVDVLFPIFEEVATRKCWICHKFSTWLRSEDPTLFQHWGTHSLSVKFSGLLTLGYSGGRSNIVLPCTTCIVPECYSEDDAGCFVEMYFTPAEEPTESIGPLSNANASTLARLSTVWSWLDTCSNSHEKCIRRMKAWYPTRLLHLSRGGRRLKLVISQDARPKGRYMTLSHRWGPQSYTKLTSSTMAQLLQAIDISTLPQVFQDFIEIATFVRIQYLWIDSLCIKQDSDDRSDWEVESQTMCKVYSNSFLNVSATLSKDGTETLFSDASWAIFLPSEIQLKVHDLVQPYYMFDGELWEDEVANAPLNNRGWVFQENFLAGRVLHFGERQMAWECWETTALEMFPNGVPQAYSGSLRSKSSNDVLGRMAKPGFEGSDEKWLGYWRSLVSRYSGCALTVPEDKLIAFLGVGLSVSALAGTEYVAGMLRETLLYDLPWHIPSLMRDTSRGRKSSRAPSWSWASVDGEVQFPEDLAHGEGIIQDVFIERLESIVAASTTAVGLPLGQGSRLSMKAAILPLGTDWLEEEAVSFTLSQLPDCEFPIDYPAGGSEFACDLSRHEVQDLDGRGVLFMLPLYSTARLLCALLLTTAEELEYRRIGAIIVPRSEQYRPLGPDDMVNGRVNGWVESVISGSVTQEAERISWNDTALRLQEYLCSVERQLITIV